MEKYKSMPAKFFLGFGNCTKVLPLILLLLISCEKLVEIDAPKNELVRSIVFNDDITANSAMAGIYADMSNTIHYLSGWQDGLKITCGQMADELSVVGSGSTNAELFENEVSAKNVQVKSIWQAAYNTNYSVNAMLEGLESSSGLSVSLKQQLEGEAKFLRAFNYFYLVNFFGDVPLIVTTDYQVTRLASRTSNAQVYEQIIQDLKDAQKLLSDDYSYSKGERIRVNKWVASAMLARVYLYRGEWSLAEAEATVVISNNSVYKLLNDLSAVFLKGSDEAIWQFYPPNDVNYNAPEAYLARFKSTAKLSKRLMDAFEVNDNRRNAWTGVNGTGPAAYSFSYKYKATSTTPPYTEYSIILRLAEQYLIRAEARAQLENITGAKADIDAIRRRAGLPVTLGNTRIEMLTAVEQERRIELFMEGGHRWLDLKRWKRADVVLGAIKPKWNPEDALLPIPEADLLKAPNLVQNPGYN